jgi:hypothetical protein
MSLHDLWEEYQNSPARRKPTRVITYREQQRAKHQPYWHKLVGDLILGLTRHGLTAIAAID